MWVATGRPLELCTYNSVRSHATTAAPNTHTSSHRAAPLTGAITCARGASHRPTLLNGPLLDLRLNLLQVVEHRDALVGDAPPLVLRRELWRDGRRPLLRRRPGEDLVAAAPLQEKPEQLDVVLAPLSPIRLRIHVRGDRLDHALGGATRLPAASDAVRPAFGLLLPAHAQLGLPRGVRKRVSQLDEPALHPRACVPAARQLEHAGRELAAPGASLPQVAEPVLLPLARHGQPSQPGGQLILRLAHVRPEEYASARHRSAYGVDLRARGCRLVAAEALCLRRGCAELILESASDASRRRAGLSGGVRVAAARRTAAGCGREPRRMVAQLAGRGEDGVHVHRGGGAAARAAVGEAVNDPRHEARNCRQRCGLCAKVSRLEGGRAWSAREGRGAGDPAFGAQHLDRHLRVRARRAVGALDVKSA